MAIPAHKTEYFIIENSNLQKKANTAKGFMTWFDFDNYMDTLSNRIDLIETSLVMHFRITTHGRTNPHNCHPFPISGKIHHLKQLSFKTNVGVCHNGVIPIKCIPKLSDTQTYIAKRLSTFKKGFYENKSYLKQIEREIQSKMCILDSTGKLFFIGDFIQDNGIFYSNYSYKSYFDFGYDIEWLCPVEGYIIDSDGLLHESCDVEYLINEDGNVYEYDYSLDCAMRLDNARAYNHYGMPFRFDEYSACYIEVIR